jgi:hypothetical protein
MCAHPQAHGVKSAAGVSEMADDASLAVHLLRLPIPAPSDPSGLIENEQPRRMQDFFPLCI